MDNVSHASFDSIELGDDEFGVADKDLEAPRKRKGRGPLPLLWSRVF